MNQSEIAVATQTGLNPHDPMAAPLIRSLANAAQKEEEIRRKYVSPPGAMKLPAKLDERRIEYAIPDAVFRAAAVFDRVLLWPLKDTDLGEGMATKHIVLTEVQRKHGENTSPRCLLVAAGLHALDELHSNGMELGDIVYLLHLNPWWMRMGRSEEGTQWDCRICSTGDLGADEDLEIARRNGTVEFVEGDDGLMRIKRNGIELAPIRPSMREDY